VQRAHTEAFSVDLSEAFDLNDVRQTFSRSPGLKVQDDVERNHFPMPLDAENQDLVLVGRLRQEPSYPRTLHGLLSGDQLRKGAATNALQIVKLLCQSASG
jgi:aspartate-semialdehyde dehydrogenase